MDSASKVNAIIKTLESLVVKTVGEGDRFSSETAVSNVWVASRFCTKETCYISLSYRQDGEHLSRSVWTINKTEALTQLITEKTVRTLLKEAAIQAAINARLVMEHALDF